jgi:hypothetical protein
MFHIAARHQWPIDPMRKALEVGEELGEVAPRVPIAEDYAASVVSNLLDRADEVDERLLPVGVLGNVALADRVEHRRSRREVERHVVGHDATGATRDRPLATPLLDAAATYLHGQASRLAHIGVASRRAQLEDRRKVVHVREVEDLR